MEQDGRRLGGMIGVVWQNGKRVGGRNVRGVAGWKESGDGGTQFGCNTAAYIAYLMSNTPSIAKF